MFERTNEGFPGPCGVGRRWIVPAALMILPMIGRYMIDNVVVMDLGATGGD